MLFTPQKSAAAWRVREANANPYSRVTAWVWGIFPPQKQIFMSPIYARLHSSKLPFILALFLILILVLGGPVMAAGHGAAAGNGSSGSGRAEGLLVAEILLLLVVGRLLGEGMQRIGQPALMGTLLAGIILGPSLFGWVWPQAQHFIFPKDEAQKGMIDGLSQVGILMLLLLTGMETDLKLVRKSGWAAMAIALCGIAFPFACGFLLGQYGPSSLFGGSSNHLATSLFLGTALSISSVKIVAMVVREMNFMRRNLGQIIVATAIMEDTVGWVIIAIIFGITGAGGGHHGVDVLNLAKTVGGVVLFLAFCFTGGRWLVFTAIRWVNDNFRSDFPVITVILVITACFAIITQLLGVRTVLGAFMAGVLIGESPILTEHIEGQLRGMITAFFMPIFFGMSGLSADLTILKDGKIALLTVGLVAIASIGKFSGAFAGATLGRLTWREGIALGCAMNARGSTEVIVASIGLSMGALSQNLYTMIVTMAVITTMAMPPMLRAALSGIPMSKEEEIRIAREVMDQRGFLPKLERLLLAVDDSAVGRMGAQLAGLLAGAQGMPVTMLKLEADLRIAANAEDESRPVDDQRHDKGGVDSAERQKEKNNDEPRRSGHAEQSDYKDSAQKEMIGAQSREERGADLESDPLAKALKAGAKKSAAKVIADDAEPDPEKVHLTARVPVDAAADVVKDEARKGYDLMFIGLDACVEPDGGFAPKITQLSAGFEGPLIVLADTSGKPAALTGRSRILVPVNGSPQSRRAAEIAFALARATGAAVHCLFVSQADGRSRTRVREESVLKDMTELGERYDVTVTSRISPRSAAADAILKEARSNVAMIVMGVSARPGEELFFGNTATSVLKAWDAPILMLAS
jgi:Kef-type K+ transport system membrane component KefB/nucleotide-binding universal stress UspA family protein